MIGNTTRGDNARGLAAYLHGPGKSNEHRYDPGAHGRVIGGNIAHVGDGDGHEWGRRLDRITRRRADIKNPIVHISLSNPATDRRLSDSEWNDIVTDLLGEQGAEGNPYVVVRHADNHIHVAISRVGFDRKIWQARRDYSKTEKVCRRSEKLYGLTAVRDVIESRANPVQEINETKTEREMAAKGVTSWKQEFRDSIDTGIDDIRKEGIGFDEALLRRGVEYEASGEGIVFSRIEVGDRGEQRNSHHISGSRLGARYTLKRLRQRVREAREWFTAHVLRKPVEKSTPASERIIPLIRAEWEQQQNRRIGALTGQLRIARDEMAQAEQRFDLSDASKQIHNDFQKVRERFLEQRDARGFGKLKAVREYEKTRQRLETKLGIALPTDWDELHRTERNYQQTRRDSDPDILRTGSRVDELIARISMVRNETLDDSDIRKAVRAFQDEARSEKQSPVEKKPVENVPPQNTPSRKKEEPRTKKQLLDQIKNRAEEKQRTWNPTPDPWEPRHGHTR